MTSSCGGTEEGIFAPKKVHADIRLHCSATHIDHMMRRLQDIAWTYIDSSIDHMMSRLQDIAWTASHSSNGRGRSSCHVMSTNLCGLVKRHGHAHRSCPLVSQLRAHFCICSMVMYTTSGNIMHLLQCSCQGRSLSLFCLSQHHVFPTTAAFVGSAMPRHAGIYNCASSRDR